MKSGNQSKNIIDLEFISQFNNGSLYAANAFRLLQLPITATDRDITRRKQILEIARKTQAPVPDGPCKIFPIDPDENHLDINSLVDSLRDPVKRFYQEFFWFWPVSDNDKQSGPDLMDRAASSTSAPLKIFSVDNYDPKEAAVNLHNLAIYNHFCALNNPERKSKIEIIEFWQDAYKYWKDLSVLSDFWSLLSDRVREFNDPRLKDTQVKTLRYSALSILAFTNAQQAARLIENGDIQGAQELLELISNNLRKLPRKNILKLAATTNRERLLAIESAVKQRIKDDPAHCDDEIESLITEGSEELKLFSTFFSNTSTEFTTLRDGLTNTILDGVDTFFNKTEDYRKSINLVKKLKQIPINSTASKEIKSRLEKYTDFGDNHNFWYCKNYFNNGIPAELFDRLEKARDSYDHQDYEVTIKMLDQIIVEYQTQSELVSKAIYPPLVLTLNQQAIEQLNKASTYFTAPRSVLDAIIRNITNNNERCLQSLYIIEKGMLRYSRYNEYNLYCMSCLSTIYGTYYTGKIKGVPYITCERCEMVDRNEVNNFKRQARPFLDHAKDCLLRANLVQPDNKIVTKNLEIVRDIFKDIYSVSIDINQQIKKEKTSETIIKAPGVPKPVSVSTSNTPTNLTETPKRTNPTTLPTTIVKPPTKPVPPQNKSDNKGLIAAAVIINLAVVILVIILFIRMISS